MKAIQKHILYRNKITKNKRKTENIKIEVNSKYDQI